MKNSDLRERAHVILDLQRQAESIKADIADLMDDAKSAGFNPRALKAALKIASLEQDKRAAHNQTQMDLELYLQEIEGR